MKKGLQPAISPDSSIIILGTMPGERSIALQQYYGNPGNKFWTILFTIFNRPVSYDYADRLTLLKENKIALWNVLRECERKGSSDSNIKNEIPNDFSWLHNNYPQISYVFFESKAAAKYFEKHCKRRAGIRYHTLPSTSGLNARTTLAEKLEAWSVLKLVVNTITTI